MAVRTPPEAPLIVIKPELSFGVLTEALNDPTDMSEIDQFRQRQFTQSLDRQCQTYSSAELWHGTTNITGSTKYFTF